MKRLLALLVTGSLLLSPALAAGADEKNFFPAVREPAAFSDVADGSWYSDAVSLCYETGLLNGTGEGKFSPDSAVTIAEAAALAARIHHIRSGGSGDLPHAPAEWGQVTLTRADGTSFSFDNNSSTGYWVDGRNIQYLYFNADQSWQAFDGQPIILNLNGTDYTGTTTWMIWNSTPSLRFQLSDPTQYTDAYYEDLWTATRRPSSDLWYRDTAWYLETVLGADLYQLGGMGQSATRLDFAQLLGLAADGLLEPINDITDVPDCEGEMEETVLPFYQAGILTGIDDYGTFDPNGTLSRAELATMAARLIRPELRQSFTLKTVDDSRYTLVPLDLKGGQADGSPRSPSLLYVEFPNHKEGEADWALYRAVGSWYTPEAGMALLGIEDDGLVLMERSDGTKAVMDSTDWSDIPFFPNQFCKLLGDGWFLSYESNHSDPVLHDRSGKAVTVLTGNGQWDVLQDGLAPCLDEGTRLFGYVDISGSWVIHPQYTRASRFSDGYAVVIRENGRGVIDTSGTLVIPCSWSSLSHRGGPFFYGSAPNQSTGVWLTADGSAVPDGAAAYGKWNITLTNGYFPCNTYYMDQAFQPVTPQIFDWTGPVDENGCAFAGQGSTVFRVTLSP